MGIRGGAKNYLITLLDLPNSGVARVKLSKFGSKSGSKSGGKRIAVDWANISYRFLTRSRNIVEFRNEFLNLIHKFAKYGIELIFIFDGNPGEKKQQTLKYRKSARDKVLNRIGNIIENVSNPEEDFETILHLSKQVKTLHPSHVLECKKLFDMIGIQYIHLKDIEADSIFKLLLDNGIADICFSGDMDLLAFGCQSIILDLDFKEDTVIEINMEQLLAYLNISDSQLLSAFILSGTDWNNGIKKSNFQQNLDLIRKYGEIPRVLDNLPEINSDLPKDRQISTPNRFDWEFSLSAYSDALGGDVLERIQAMLEKERKQIECLKLLEGFNILLEYGKLFLDGDVNFKYTRKYQECILWKYVFRLNLTPALEYTQKPKPHNQPKHSKKN
jgi:5'-3' exonuclease